MGENIKKLLKKIYDDETSIPDVLGFLDSSSIFLRAHAIRALGKKLKKFPHNLSEEQLNEITHKLRLIAGYEENMTSPLIGIYTVSHFAIACLFQINTPQSLDLAREFLESLSANQELTMKFINTWGEFLSD
ncbi:MAG: hypothetical protein BroJett018_16190 [Chloroflexota bacterium]|nr:hypothetical protein [Chloroflexota bacterium]NOG65697.1 hypothetical protein [Chloroflexota bacterium]GIK63825.1 MAG: hypothetical protein BroJett018_16190 [Chloroflexota bacterium]